MHLAFLCPSASGHLNPVLPLVHELVGRGHRVSLPTAPSTEPAVRAAGALPVPLPSEITPANISNIFTAEDLAAILEAVLAQARTDFPVLTQHFRQHRPDAVCFDTINPLGRMLADLLSVPAIGLVPNLASDENSPMSDTFVPEAFDFTHPRLVACQARLDDFAAEYGLGTMPHPMSEVLAGLNLVFVPRQFQPRGDEFDQRFRFIGPSPLLRQTYEHDSQAQRWWPKHPELPLVFVSLGTVFNDRPEFFRTCVEAFRDSAWQVAIAVGDRGKPDSLSEIPPNVEIRPRFPQLDVLRDASVFVTHCGMGSTMEALTLSVPMVTVARTPEQQTNAERVVELDLGVSLENPGNGRPTALEIRSAVDAVRTDEHRRARVAEMSRIIAECGGPTEGADAIENYVTG